MKLLLLILSSFSLFGTAFADALCPCNPLMNVIVDEVPLSRDNLLSGKPIYAHKIEITSGASSSGTEIVNQNAYYLHGTIVTHLSEFNNDYGRQTVTFINIEKYPGDPLEKSNSFSWSVETFNSKRYIMHQHDGFCVYTSKDEQFVIAK